MSFPYKGRKFDKPVKAGLEGLFFYTGVEIVDHRLYRWKFQVVLKGIFIPEFFTCNELRVLCVSNSES
jgi:hypothetical protein